MRNQPFDPGNLKIKRQKILFFFMDHNWHDANELVDKFGSAWNQRKNLDFIAKGKLKFITRFVKGTKALFEYRLLTPNFKIDLEHTCLIPDLPLVKLPPVKPLPETPSPVITLTHPHPYYSSSFNSLWRDSEPSKKHPSTKPIDQLKLF